MALNGTSSLLDGTIGVGDSVLIEPLNEDNFVENLQLRFQHDNIYTFIGSVVVSINPYKPLSIYDSETIEKYRGRNLYELPPHIFAVSNLAYSSMKNYGRDQCILITGESGSGKTEASKLVMKYVSAVSSRSTDVERIKEQLLQSNPVLEAFGNAKTNRNDNSSRFGKYMDIEFDFKGDPIGGVITNYLLEKSRVVRQAAGERNFHIFYLLMCGAPAALLQKLKLEGGAENYSYLKQGECFRSDVTFFKEVMEAFDVIGFSQVEVDDIMHLVAAILKLGNVIFKSSHQKNGMETCEVENTEEVTGICDLLSLESSVLISALTERRVVTSQDTVTCTLSANEASYSRNALCKEMYDRLFTWLVARINSSIRANEKQHKQCRVMGVLDIYGFEVFDNNGFEQFMINYCNEKLQQIFIELTLKEEQEEYVKEGIEWLHIDYFNNAIICQLIESAHTGILSALDEECLRPGDVTDQTFLSKLESTYGKHDHFESRADSRFLTDKSLPHEAFRILHYAGKVTYLIENFIDKNNNALYRSLSVAAFMSKNSLLGGKNGLFPEGDPSLSVLKRAPTIATQFKASMTALMKNLLSKNPNYIRCIKPNNVKRSSVFTPELVRHQVRYLGLLENVRVRRAGYAYRQKYEECLKRYKMLSKNTWPSWKGSAREGMRNILSDTHITGSEYECGKTKLFIRNPRTLFTLEKMRSDKLHDIATIIQKSWKGFYLWKKFQIMRKAQIEISKNVKRYQAQQSYLKLRAATIVFQTYIRGWKARCLLRAHKLHKRRCQAVTTISSHWRGHVTRVEYRKFFRANARKVIGKMMDKFVVYQYLTELAAKLPPMSPVNTEWPPCKYAVFSDAHKLLQKIYHAWRCMKYRKSLTPERIDQLKEKLQASTLFNGKKSSYATSLPLLFSGDHVQLTGDLQWKKIATENGDATPLFADNGFKINRADGKVVSCTVVLTKSSLMLVDDKFKMKSRILVNDVKKVSFSPFADGMMIVHSEPQDTKNHKGDLILNVSNVIELATKLSMLKESNSQDLSCVIAKEINLQCKVAMQLTFSPENGIESPVVKKHKNTFNVTVPQ